MLQSRVIHPRVLIIADRSSHATWSGEPKLLWHKRVRRDEEDSVIEAKKARLVMSVRRHRETVSDKARLFVLEIKEVEDGITENAARDKLHASAVAPVGSEENEGILTKDYYQKPFLFRGLDESLTGSYVATLSLIEVSEDECFKPIAGILREGCLTPAQLVRAEERGGWTEDVNGATRPPPSLLEADNCAESKEPSVPTGATSGKFAYARGPQLVQRPDGHISYSKEPGITIGGSVGGLSKVLEHAWIKDIKASNEDATKAFEKQKSLKRTFRTIEEEEEEEGIVLERGEGELKQERKRLCKQQEERDANARARVREKEVKVLRKTRTVDDKPEITGKRTTKGWLGKGFGFFG